ncbi:zinc finger BED domain-containing protein 5-like [Macrobrachium rosenbergii]|uniref:zinc finger BED domain-containing protein 5-like n=1 Tax=Macrobrachium rosenbergii TaxID=79674 RepID=UPI0034D62ADD
MVKKVSVADTALESSFRVAELIAKKMKPHTTGEEIIGHACNIIVETMLGKEAQGQISKVPLSNNTISRRISEMSTDINEEVVKQTKSKRKFALQGRLEGIVTSVNKMKGFQRELKSWKSAVQKDDVSNFPSLQQPGYNGFGTVKNLILNHLEQLREAADKYFPSLSTEKLDWIVSPFKLADMAEELDFTAIERGEFLDMSADSTLKVKFEKGDVTLEAFWHGTLGEYPNLAKKAISLLLPFSTSYLCEQAFSAMATIKSKQRNRLLSLEDDMRVALSTIRSDIKSLCSKHQSQVSH